MKVSDKFEIGKQYISTKDGLIMFSSNGIGYNIPSLKSGEIVTLQEDPINKYGFMLVRKNGEISNTLQKDLLEYYIRELEMEDAKVDNEKVVNENQINYEDEYNRIVGMYKELSQENEDLKKALVKIALKL